MGVTEWYTGLVIDTHVVSNYCVKCVKTPIIIINTNSNSGMQHMHLNTEKQLICNDMEVETLAGMLCTVN